MYQGQPYFMLDALRKETGAKGMRIRESIPRFTSLV
jgi:hypothetical protein